ncbi:hypothetical protein FRACA_70020 [Frankia canadensis]|uniref:Uncharacterized protein n=1 Tax=Frankia canadensis TaxID=1836972 RepID=A0A2I2L0H2_9ACTN|nr:hypothetical protein FRACA_70020 [Frankia canadensis]SOU58694.1 hypothetical protein FRACA_70020 [Frankia canadensis]
MPARVWTTSCLGHHADRPWPVFTIGEPALSRHRLSGLWTAGRMAPRGHRGDPDRPRRRALWTVLDPPATPVERGSALADDSASQHHAPAAVDNPAGMDSNRSQPRDGWAPARHAASAATAGRGAPFGTLPRDGQGRVGCARPVLGHRGHGARSEHRAGDALTPGAVTRPRPGHRGGRAQ